MATELQNVVERRIAEASRYVSELDWALTFVHGTGEKAKAPVFPGWPDLRPTPEIVREVLSFDWDTGIGLNLGASGLVDVEGDSPEAEVILDDLCRGLSFPCWVSRKSKHRLFLRQPEIDHLDAKELKIEFRTGRHQSVLPPSVIAGTEYRWIVNPFEVRPQPLPEQVVSFYEELRRKPTTKTEGDRKPAERRWPYRDQRDYVLRQFDLQAEAEKAGVRFAWSQPDANGNIACFVPSQLRGGDEDQNASGVFNVFNGVLRDFAAEKNHLFFNVMAALTGEPWQDVFARYEAEADAISGRPHTGSVKLLRS